MAVQQGRGPLSLFSSRQTRTSTIAKIVMPTMIPAKHLG